MQTRFYIKPCHSGNHLVLLLCLTLSLATSAGATDNNFYQDTKHGWFWYETPPPEPVKPEIKPDPAIKLRIMPSLDNYTIDDLWNLYPDDFQTLLNDLQKKAVQTPDEQNIMEYLTMQDIARRKALAYTNATMYVTQKYGDLFNVNQVYPAAGPGITARVQMQQTEIAQTINQAGANHAIIFFVSPGCGFCEQQGTNPRLFRRQIRLADQDRKYQHRCGCRCPV